MSWDDCVWAYFKVMVDLRVEQVGPQINIHVGRNKFKSGVEILEKNAKLN